MQDQETMLSVADVTLLLPWYGASRVAPALACQIEAQLGRDTTLQRAFAAIERERDGIVALNQSLGRPSSRVLASLFAGIDAIVAADKISA